jgi:hypothetical protein
LHRTRHVIGGNARKDEEADVVRSHHAQPGGEEIRGIDDARLEPLRRLPKY